jgi:hypothetical protein
MGILLICFKLRVGISSVEKIKVKMFLMTLHEDIDLDCM